MFFVWELEEHLRRTASFLDDMLPIQTEQQMDTRSATWAESEKSKTAISPNSIPYRFRELLRPHLEMLLR